MRTGGPAKRGRSLVLASASPQRRAILESVGVEFEVRPQDVDEDEAGSPREVALENARRKAMAAATSASAEDVVLGVDTLVALDDRIWGKPADEREARTTLRALAGRTHEVHSGVVVVEGGRQRGAHEVTAVTFRDLDDATIDWYVGCREWEGRAGGYAIQGRGAALVRRIEGDYLNVVGLPLAALLDLFPALIDG